MGSGLVPERLNAAKHTSALLYQVQVGHYKQGYSHEWPSQNTALSCQELPDCAFPTTSCGSRFQETPGSVNFFWPNDLFSSCFLPDALVLAPAKKEYANPLAIESFSFPVWLHSSLFHFSSLVLPMEVPSKSFSYLPVLQSLEERRAFQIQGSSSQFVHVLFFRNLKAKKLTTVLKHHFSLFSDRKWSPGPHWEDVQMLLAITQMATTRGKPSLFSCILDCLAGQTSP